MIIGLKGRQVIHFLGHGKKSAWVLSYRIPGYPHIGPWTDQQWCPWPATGAYGHHHVQQELWFQLSRWSQTLSFLKWYKVPQEPTSHQWSNLSMPRHFSHRKMSEMYSILGCYLPPSSWCPTGYGIGSSGLPKTAAVWALFDQRVFNPDWGLFLNTAGNLRRGELEWF